MTTEQLLAAKVGELGTQPGDPHLALLEKTKKAPTGGAETPTKRPVLRRADFTIGPVARFRKRLRRARTLGLLGLFVVCVTISLAVVAVAPAIGLGWTSVVITSGSMSPLLRTGDVVVASPHDGVGLGPGAVVVFSDPARPGLLTHRIEAVNPDGSYVTSGVANRQSDSTPLQPEQVVAVGRIRVPFVGMPLVWFWAKAWGQLAVWAAVTLGAVWLARYAFLEEEDLRTQSEKSGIPISSILSTGLSNSPKPASLVAEEKAGNDGREVPSPGLTAVATTPPIIGDPSEESESLGSLTTVGVLRGAPARIKTVREAPSSGPGPGQRRPLSRPRQTNSANVSRSEAEIPRVTTFDEVDVSRLLGVQQALGTRFDTEIPLEAVMVMAVIPALRNFPDFNATLHRDELVFHSAYDVGFTVETLDGSVTAVIRDAAAKGLMELASEVHRLGEGAKSGSLSPGELTGQKFTVANLGAVGGGHSTPIVPPRTTAILSVGRAQQKPIVVDGELVIAPVMPLSLSYDDRVIDDGLGRRFMVQVVENLEEPALFLVT